MAKQKRIHELAKELGVNSKLIVEKCQAEGIPESVVKNHLSPVSAGLEATIREWFTEGVVTTAVENSQPVDLAKVKRPRSKKSASAHDGDHDSDSVEESSTQIAVAEPPPAPVEAPAPAASAVVVEPPAPPPPPVEEETPEEESAPDPVEVVAPPAPLHEEPPKRQIPERRAVSMNAPTRPKDVRPAGPKLEVQSPVRLSGPKIVRIESPEPVSTPRPRRPDSQGAGGPGREQGGGAGAGADRRGPGGAGGGGRGRTDQRRPGADDAKRREGGVPARRRGVAGEDWTKTTAGAWSEQDLAEREARLARAGGYLKKRRQQIQQHSDRADSEDEDGPIKIAAPFTIKELSAATGVKAAEIVKKLFMQGVMATVNSGIEPEKAQEIMMDFDIELNVVEAKSAEQVLAEGAMERSRGDERLRGPVVTIMGHVDHGKTSLLDRIRNANVAAGEAGGITQRTSAFRVPVKANNSDKFITFIDTPGHQAFTQMRSRGATVTDIVVLVVAADDGVMPQTVESINHARAAGVPIVVALNKVDRAEATDQRYQEILGQLAGNQVNTVPWGGETELVKTSAHTGQGIQELLDTLDLQAEVLELRADFSGAAQGSVLESNFKEGRGAVATIIVQEGRLGIGDFIVAGRAFGRVRDILNDRGEKITEAFPPMPVQISGIDELPEAGDAFYIVDSLRVAEDAAQQRRQRERERQLAQPKLTLDSLFGKIAESDMKEILVVLKADFQGSVDVLKGEIEKVSTVEVKVRVLHSAVGGITESDVLLAEASRAVIIGFNVIPQGKARSLADQKGVEIRTYDVIYHIAEDLRKAAEGMLAPELRQEVLGHAEVRAVFKVTKVGSIAGCYVTDGTVQRDALIRVTRNGIVIENDRRLEQLKRFKDDAKDVRAGMECGMKIIGYDDIKEGDILECYKQVEVKRTL